MVLAEGDNYVRLTLNDKPNNLNLITFAPNPDDKGIIIATQDDSAFYFFDTAGVKYKWVGDLRSEHAQRVANNFASNLSRVGLDESEWLRLWATKG